MGFKKRFVLRKRRAGSRAAAIENLLLPYARQYRGTPTTFAIALSYAMQQPVSRQVVWKILRENNLTLKSDSFIPSFSIQAERDIYLAHLKQIWTHPNQFLFMDEKKFRTGETMMRSVMRGYAPIDERLPRLMSSTVALRPVLPKTVEVIGALGVLPNEDVAPLLQERESGRPSSGIAAREGKLGIVYALVKPDKINESDILAFFTELATIMSPYPGPNSVVVLDNMPSHRKNEEEIKRIINAKGGVVLFQPPNSPDLNPIEKAWDVIKAFVNREIVSLAAGSSGASRPFSLGDLVRGIQEVRLSLHTYSFCFGESAPSFVPRLDL
jgi:hypothetical protein